MRVHFGGLNLLNPNELNQPGQLNKPNKPALPSVYGWLMLEAM